jgi:hypothetical protein
MPKDKLGFQRSHKFGHRVLDDLYKEDALLFFSGRSGSFAWAAAFPVWSKRAICFMPPVEHTPTGAHPDNPLSGWSPEGALRRTPGISFCWRRWLSSKITTDGLLRASPFLGLLLFGRPWALSLHPWRTAGSAPDSVLNHRRRASPACGRGRADRLRQKPSGYTGQLARFRHVSPPPRICSGLLSLALRPDRLWHLRELHS